MKSRFTLWHQTKQLPGGGTCMTGSYATGMQRQPPAADPGRSVHDLLPLSTSHGPTHNAAYAAGPDHRHRSNAVQTLVCDMHDVTPESWLDSCWSGGATSAGRECPPRRKLVITASCHTRQRLSDYRRGGTSCAMATPTHRLLRGENRAGPQTECSGFIWLAQILRKLSLFCPSRGQ